MGVYINRDELLELYANTDKLDISNYDVKIAVIRQNILDMPTIDIVRCKDCKYVGKTDVDWVCNGGFEIECADPYEGGQAIVQPLDFCSYGERRE